MQAHGFIFIVVLIISIVIHEVAHGWAAYKLGDPTAKAQGRLSLNPLVHLDWVGSVILPGLLILTSAPFIIGWAKPVPFNPAYFKNQKWDSVKVALAGPVSNILLASLGSFLLYILPFGAGGEIFLTSFVFINIVLSVFNMVPIPPLDGHHILFALIPDRFSYLKHALQQYSLIILLVFIIYGWKFIYPVVNMLLSVFL